MRDAKTLAEEFCRESRSVRKFAKMKSGKKAAGKVSKSAQKSQPKLMSEAELESTFSGANDNGWKPSGQSNNIEPVSRKEAFRKAKRDARVPKCSSPDKITKVDMTELEYCGGHKIKDKNGKIVSTREYTFTTIDGKSIVIQEHSYPHLGSQGPHFNVRPQSNTRTGKVPGTEDHYLFKK